MINLNKTVDSYINNGFYYIKVKTDKTKAPIVKRQGDSWKSKEYRHGDAQLKTLLRGTNSGRYGVGAVIPEGMICIDIDTKEDIAVLQKAFKGKDILKDTLVCKSGRGFHLFYHIPESFRASNYQKKGFLKNTQIRGRGTYQIMPPSLHYSGRHYELYNAGSVSDMPVEIIQLFKKWNKEIKEDSGTAPDANPIKTRVDSPCYSLKRLEAMLNKLDPTDYDNREDFFKILSAAKHACNNIEGGFKVFQTWAEGDNTYNTAKDKKVNRSHWRGALTNLQGRTPYTYKTLLSEIQAKHNLSKPQLDHLTGEAITTEKLIGLLSDEDYPPKKKKKKRNKKGDKVAEVKIGNTDPKILMLGIQEIINNGDMQGLANFKNVIDAVQLALRLPPVSQPMAFAEIAGATGFGQGAAQQKEFKRIYLDPVNQALTEENEIVENEIVDDLIDNVLIQCKKQKIIALISGEEVYSYNNGLWTLTKKTTLGATILPILNDYILDNNIQLPELTEKKNVWLTNLVDRVCMKYNTDAQGLPIIKKYFPELYNKMDWRAHGGQTNIFEYLENLKIKNRIASFPTPTGEITFNYRKMRYPEARNTHYNSRTKVSVSILKKYFVHMNKDVLQFDNARVKVLPPSHKRYNNFEYQSQYIKNADFIKAIDQGKLNTFFKFICLIVKGTDNPFAQALYFLDSMAYMMQPIKTTPAFFYHMGAGENGKSFVMKALESIMPSGKIKNRDMTITENNSRFFMGMLKGTYCIYDDDKQDFNQAFIGMLKQNADINGYRDAEEKNKRDLTTVYMKASMVALSNRYVEVNDKSEGLRRRLFTFTFKNSLKDSFSFENGEKILNSEIQYLFNLLLRLLPRIINVGLEKTIEMVKLNDELILGSDPFYGFKESINLCPSKSPLHYSNYATVHELFGQYKDFIEDELPDLNPRSNKRYRSWFVEQLRLAGFQVITSKNQQKVKNFALNKIIK
ncbi:MAG: hypothetical protein GY941_19775 [Planctomycetes bacterium]|nr:hypothetical protein [Planctomycetota bacterium]